MRSCRGSNQSMASYKSSAVAEAKWSDSARELEAVSSSKPAGSGQLGARLEDAGGNESADEIALGAASAGEQIVQAEVAKGTEDSGDMPMRKRSEDLKGLVAGDQILPLQDATQEIDLSGGPGKEIGKGAFVDLGADADRFAEEDGRGRVAIGDGLDIHGSILLR